MENNYKIAVPTHRRSDKIGDLTLKVLEDFPPTNIYLFISDEEDYKLYQELYASYNLILTHTDNITSKFNFVQQYFPEGEWVVILEDDIKEVQDLQGRHLTNLLWYMLRFCQSNKIEAFGVYPSSNMFFMKNTIEVGLTFMVGNFFGFKSKKNLELNCSLKSKIDYERSVLYFLEYGKIARFNFVSCKTNNYTNAGGMNTTKENRQIKEKEASEELVKKYPHIFSFNNKRKSGFTELKMNKKVKVKKL